MYHKTTIILDYTKSFKKVISLEYNREQYRKINDKKILHKVRKQWVTVSLALLSMIGGGSLLTQRHIDTQTTQPTDIEVAANHLHRNLLTNRVNQSIVDPFSKPKLDSVKNPIKPDLTANTSVAAQNQNEGSRAGLMLGSIPQIERTAQAPRTLIPAVNSHGITSNTSSYSAPRANPNVATKIINNRVNHTVSTQVNYHGITSNTSSYSASDPEIKRLEEQKSTPINKVIKPNSSIDHQINQTVHPEVNNPEIKRFNEPQSYSVDKLMTPKISSDSLASIGSGYYADKSFSDQKKTSVSSASSSNSNDNYMASMSDGVWNVGSNSFEGVVTLRDSMGNYPYFIHGTKNKQFTIPYGNSSLNAWVSDSDGTDHLVTKFSDTTYYDGFNFTNTTTTRVSYPNSPISPTLTFYYDGGQTLAYDPKSHRYIDKELLQQDPIYQNHGKGQYGGADLSLKMSDVQSNSTLKLTPPPVKGYIGEPVRFNYSDYVLGPTAALYPGFSLDPHHPKMIVVLGEGSDTNNPATNDGGNYWVGQNKNMNMIAPIRYANVQYIYKGKVLISDQNPQIGMSGTPIKILSDFSDLKNKYHDFNMHKNLPTYLDNFAVVAGQKATFDSQSSVSRPQIVKIQIQPQQIGTVYVPVLVRAWNNGPIKTDTETASIKDASGKPTGLYHATVALHYITYGQQHLQYSVSGGTILPYSVNNGVLSSKKSVPSDFTNTYPYLMSEGTLPLTLDYDPDTQKEVVQWSTLPQQDISDLGTSDKSSGSHLSNISKIGVYEIPINSTNPRYQQYTERNNQSLPIFYYSCPLHGQISDTFIEPNVYYNKRFWTPFDRSANGLKTYEDDFVPGGSSNNVSRSDLIKNPEDIISDLSLNNQPLKGNRAAIRDYYIAAPKNGGQGATGYLNKDFNIYNLQTFWLNPVESDLANSRLPIGRVTRIVNAQNVINNPNFLNSQGPENSYMLRFYRLHPGLSTNPDGSSNIGIDRLKLVGSNRISINNGTSYVQYIGSADGSDGYNTIQIPYNYGNTDTGYNVTYPGNNKVDNETLFYPRGASIFAMPDGKLCKYDFHASDNDNQGDTGRDDLYDNPDTGGKIKFDTVSDHIIKSKNGNYYVGDVNAFAQPVYYQAKYLYSKNNMSFTNLSAPSSDFVYGESDQSHTKGSHQIFQDYKSSDKAGSDQNYLFSEKNVLKQHPKSDTYYQAFAEDIIGFDSQKKAFYLQSIAQAGDPTKRHYFGRIPQYSKTAQGKTGLNNHLVYDSHFERSYLNYVDNYEGPGYEKHWLTRYQNNGDPVWYLGVGNPLLNIWPDDNNHVDDNSKYVPVVYLANQQVIAFNKIYYINISDGSTIRVNIPKYKDNVSPDEFQQMIFSVGNKALGTNFDMYNFLYKLIQNEGSGKDARDTITYSQLLKDTTWKLRQGIGEQRKYKYIVGTTAPNTFNTTNDAYLFVSIKDYNDKQYWGNTKMKIHLRYVDPQGDLISDSPGFIPGKSDNSDEDPSKEVAATGFVHTSTLDDALKNGSNGVPLWDYLDHRGPKTPYGYQEVAIEPGEFETLPPNYKMQDPNDDVHNPLFAKDTNLFGRTPFVNIVLVPAPPHFQIQFNAIQKVQTSHGMKYITTPLTSDKATDDVLVNGSNADDHTNSVYSAANFVDKLQQLAKQGYMFVKASDMNFFTGVKNGVNQYTSGPLKLHQLLPGIDPSLYALNGQRLEVYVGKPEEQTKTVQVNVKYQVQGHPELDPTIRHQTITYRKPWRMTFDPENGYSLQQDNWIPLPMNGHLDNVPSPEVSGYQANQAIINAPILNNNDKIQNSPYFYNYVVKYIPIPSASTRSNGNGPQPPYNPVPLSSLSSSVSSSASGKANKKASSKAKNSKRKLWQKPGRRRNSKRIMKRRTYRQMKATKQIKRSLQSHPHMTREQYRQEMFEERLKQFLSLHPRLSRYEGRECLIGLLAAFNHQKLISHDSAYLKGYQDFNLVRQAKLPQTGEDQLQQKLAIALLSLTAILLSCGLMIDHRRRNQS